MTLQELQKQVLQLPISDRWQLVQVLLESLKQETRPMLKRGNLSRLRGIAKSSVAEDDTDLQIDEFPVENPFNAEEAVNCDYLPDGDDSAI